MTRSRLSTTRELYGMIGRFPDGNRLQASWNRYFQEQGIDATMDRYPATSANLPERLSEMFHFDRRAYLVGSSLQEAIIPLLDDIDPSAAERGKVDAVLNERGVLRGVFAGDHTVAFLHKRIIAQ